MKRNKYIIWNTKNTVQYLNTFPKTYNPITSSLCSFKDHVNVYLTKKNLHFAFLVPAIIYFQ